MSEVYVITAHYSDMSGAKVLGVYESETIAHDIANACKAAQGAMTVVVLSMALNKIEDRDVRGDEPSGEESEGEGK